MALFTMAARAEDGTVLETRIGQLEAEIRQLQGRVEHLGLVTTSREIRIADPVFVGAGSVSPSPLAMDDPAINCPARSFVTAIQIIKTSNTVTQVRYACRGIE
jgi:hypothetical protein